MAKKIKIDVIHGGGDGSDLKNCYFLPATAPATGYEFFDKNNNSLATGISGGPGASFTFNLTGNPNNGNPWTISNLSIIVDTSATGDWSNSDATADPEPTGETGTWTAQAGTGADDDAVEGVSSAYA